MSVYFIRLGQYLKVGYSETPERRFRRLFSGTTGYTAPWDCPRRLADRSLLGHVAGSKDDEQRAHRALADFSVGCEFYLAEQSAMDYVTRCLSADDIVTERVTRAAGPAPLVGQVPPGSDVWSLSDITSARKVAS